MKLLLSFILIICFGCREDEPKGTVIQGKPNRLDVDSFRIVNDTAVDFEGDSVRTLTVEKHHYKLSTQILDCNIKQIYYYDRKTLLPKYFFGYLGDMAVGRFRAYKDGKVYWEKDLEQDYPFNAQMLVLKLRKDYKIDLLHYKDMHLSRGKNYHIALYNFPTKEKFRYLEIDGKTGLIVIDSTGYNNNKFSK